MSGAHGPKGLTRRNFLKTTGAAGVAAVAAGAAAPQLAAIAEGYEPGQPETQGEQIFRGVCRPNCFGFCHLNVHVRDGKVVKTSRAEYNESCYTRICQRGLSHVQRIYDPKRLKYPMRRVEGTERGAGEWERISWDEALQEIAGNIRDTQKQYGEGALAFLTASGNQAVAITSAYSRLASLLNASSIMPCLDMGSYYGMTAVAGNYISPLMGMGMWEGNEPTDAKNAKSIVVWGANITDAQIQNWHLVKEAMQGGTKLVVIDPTFTQIAAKADKWISVRPGSDTLLKYALMNIVLEKNAQDVDYLRDHTVAPFLVREDTGMFLRRSDMGIEPTATGKTNPTTGQEIVRCCSMAAIIAPSYFQTPCSGGFFIFRAWKPPVPMAPISNRCLPIPWANRGNAPDRVVFFSPYGPFMEKSAFVCRKSRNPRVETPPQWA